MSPSTIESFSLALYRILAVVDTKEAAPPWEACKERLLEVTTAYLDHDGPLPYNGFSSSAYSHSTVLAHFKALGRDVEMVMEPHDINMFRVIDVVLMEQCRVWMELSGVKDVTHPIH